MTTKISTEEEGGHCIAVTILPTGIIEVFVGYEVSRATLLYVARVCQITLVDIKDCYTYEY